MPCGKFNFIFINIYFCIFRLFKNTKFNTSNIKKVVIVFADRVPAGKLLEAAKNRLTYKGGGFDPREGIRISYP